MKFITMKKFEKPLSGTGAVKLGKTTFTINLNYKVGKNKFENESFTFKLDDLPEGFKVSNGKEYFMNVQADGGAFYEIRPASGVFTVVCTGVARDKREETDFCVIEKHGEFGTYWQTVVNLKIAEGDYEGVVIPLYLPWAAADKKTGDKNLRFVSDDDGNLTVWGDPKSKGIEQFYDLIEMTGLGDVEIPYPEFEEDEEPDEQQILALFHKAIRKSKNEFTVSLKDGYVKSMMIKNNSQEVVEEEPEDEPVVKKSVKKVVEDVVAEPAKKKAKPKFEDDEPF